MASIKLQRIPDRTPVKVTIAVPPELYRALTDYADAYRTAYGEAEPMTVIIPAMLAAFLESDRAFSRARKSDGSS